MGASRHLREQEVEQHDPGAQREKHIRSVACQHAGATRSADGAGLLYLLARAAAPPARDGTHAFISYVS